MTFVLLDIVGAAVLAFTIGLYIGAFVQRHRDIKERAVLTNGLMIILSIISRKKEDAKC